MPPLPHKFVMRQCAHPGCRFRFPAPTTAAGNTQDCPRCGSPTRAGTPVLGGAADADSPAAPRRAPPLSALLDNIRSIHNVGSMFRAADGAGLAHLYLGGITATPAHPKLAKAALGAHESVPWSWHPNGLETAVSLRAAGHRLWAIETGPPANSLFGAGSRPADGPILFIVGNEQAGIDPDILALCDRTLALPMAGRKRSLNAAVAFGIAAYVLRFGSG